MSQPNIIEEIKTSLRKYNGQWSEKKGLWSFTATIAERKAFLSKKKLSYSAKMRIDDAAKIIHFSEMLSESSSGLSAGGGIDDMSPGFGVKKESYNTLGSARQGSIEEQSKLFGKDYSYSFNYQEIRALIQEIANKYAYQFNYQILPVK
ncbi:MAG: hypothetical protein ACPL3P_02075 [Anaerolineales bacterium]